MILDVIPRRLEATPGQPQELTVTVTNTTDVIGGYTVRVLGADPGWVHSDLETGRFSLFPDEARSLTIQVTVPHGIPAGERRMAIQLRELTGPEESRIEEIVLVVPDDPAVSLRTDPVAVTAGRTGRFSVIVDNTGNTTVSGELAGTDPEGKVRFRFDPPTLSLAPGEHAVVDLRTSARQRLFGSPAVRVLDLYLDPPGGAPTVVAEPEEVRRLRVGRRRRPPTVAERDAAPLTKATFVQKPFVARGALSLIGLLAAVTVFALVITLAFSRLVGQSAADRNLALKIASARNAGAGTGTSSLSGVVRLLTSGRPVPGVAVALFGASDTSTPLATTATGADGAWSVSELPAGDYKVTFRGAGFVQLWYPQSLDADSGATLTLDANTARTGLDVSIGGVPATLSGTVKGEDVSAATLTLRTPDATATTAGGAGGANATGAAFRPAADTIPASGVSPAAAGAIVKTLPIGADGTFTLEDVPSPSVYVLEVSKPGYATSSQRIDVGAGETRSELTIPLRKGDGLISGTVSSATGPLGKVTLTATSGQTSVTTVSLDGRSDKGTFTLRGLPTPAQFTLVASADGYASQTLSLSLAPGQQLTGVSITLGRSSGDLSGKVLLSLDGDPAPGVGVTVTDGQQTIQTATRSSGQGVGSWSVSGLSLPGTYTVTFARSDLASHTLSVSLDGAGNITPASQGGGVGATSIEVTLHSSTAQVHGVVRQVPAAGGTAQPVGEATVTLTTGTTSYAVTSASLPDDSVGQYRLQGVPPGTYTVSVTIGGTSPTSTILNLAAGEDRGYSPKLAAAAAISGVVQTADGSAVSPGWIVELYRVAAYPTTVYRQTTTRAGGAFDFGNLDAPETYVVQVRPTRGSAPAGSITLQLSASQRLTGLVVSTGG
jgi:5-hydroxyisourate hydrolase-like protein (transthyretin family)